MVRLTFAMSALVVAGVTSPVSVFVSAAPASARGTSNIGKRFTIPVRKVHPGPSSSTRTVYERDISRVVAYNKPRHPTSRSFDADLSLEENRRDSGTATNEGVSYVADIRICEDTYSLIVDTGSSNTWAGAQPSKKVPPTCGDDTLKTFTIGYGSGQVKGTEVVGPVSFADPTVAKQSFGSADTAQGFARADGIVGFGPVGLTQGTVEGEENIPTFMNNLYADGTISEETLGVYFAPVEGSSIDDANGELTLGGVDDWRFFGELFYFRTTTVEPYAAYWGIDVSAVTFIPSINPALATNITAIVDTGTTLILLPSSVYRAFLNAAGHGAEVDSKTSLTRFDSKPFGVFGIEFSGVPFMLTPDQYLVPQEQYENYGLTKRYYYSWIVDSGSDDPKDVNFLIGQKFLEHYYSAYTTGHGTEDRIGLAART